MLGLETATGRAGDAGGLSRVGWEAEVAGVEEEEGGGRMEGRKTVISTKGSIMLSRLAKSPGLGSCWAEITCG